MNGFAFRFMLLTLLCLGIVLPQASAALAAMGLADGRAVVICTGDGLRTIRIDDNGEPVEISQDAEICALLHAAETSVTSLPGEGATPLVYFVGPIKPASTDAPVHAYSPSLPRGPPAS